MNLDQAADLCRKFEGFRAKPYLCPANVWTIGFGSTYYPDGWKVQPTDQPVTIEYAESVLIHELLKTYAPGVMRLCPEVFADAMRTGEWGPFNALVDFTYNLGVGKLQTSTLRRKARALDWEGVKEELQKWNRGGGKVLPGLVKRRAAEVALLP